MTDFTDTKPAGLYEAAIGEKNQDYYVNKFEDFDQQGPGLHASWNWAAFFFTGFWALYRKMYGWFFAWWGLATVAGIFERVQSAGFQQTMAAALVVMWLTFSAFANSLYHAKVKAKIAAAQKSNSDALRVTKRLSGSGGVLIWVPIVCIGIPAIGVLAAVALPAYQGYAKRSTSPITQIERVNPSVENQSATPQLVPFTGTLDEAPPKQANVRRSQIDEFLSDAPKSQLTGTPMQLNAEKANPFDQFDPSTARPVDDANNRPFTYEEAIAPKTQSAVDQEHYRRIYAAHPDADAIHDSPSFRTWVSRYPTYQRIVAKGTTQEIIEMFTAYKNQR